MARNDETARRLATIPGMINATALAVAVGKARAFQRGRTWRRGSGWPPAPDDDRRQKPRLLGISKRGNRYLRKNLIHGARAVLPYLGQANCGAMQPCLVMVLMGNSGWGFFL
jgi:transposase